MPNHKSDTTQADVRGQIVHRFFLKRVILEFRVRGLWRLRPSSEATISQTQACVPVLLVSSNVSARPVKK